MKIAVLTLTRDRLAYTKHCFQTLRDHSGIPYDHFVLDQGSTDGTQEWLAAQDDIESWVLEENVGICKGLNLLLDAAVDVGEYDVLIKFDNDCELLTPDTLRDVCRAVLEMDAVLSPRIHGLRQPPPILTTVTAGEWTVDLVSGIGGIFLAAPARIFQGGYRHNEGNPLWGGDDADLCARWRQTGRPVGYLRGYDANHYETSEGQEIRYPEYHIRKMIENGATVTHTIYRREKPVREAIQQAADKEMV